MAPASGSGRGAGWRWGKGAGLGAPRASRASRGSPSASRPSSWPFPRDAPRELARAIRYAYDPGARVDVARRDDKVSRESAGVSMHGAWPLSTDHRDPHGRRRMCRLCPHHMCSFATHDAPRRSKISTGFGAC